MTAVGAWFGRRSERAKAKESEAAATEKTTAAANATVEAILKWALMLADRITSLEKLVAERDTVIIQLRTQVTGMEFEIRELKKLLTKPEMN